MVFVNTQFDGKTALGVGSFAFPFTGLSEKIANSAALVLESSRLSPRALFELLCPLSLLAQACYLALRPAPNCPFWAFGAGFALLFCVLGSPVWAEQVAYARVLLPLTFAFNFCLLNQKGRSYTLWWLVGNFGMAFPAYKILL